MILGKPLALRRVLPITLSATLIVVAFAACASPSPTVTPTLEPAATATTHPTDTPVPPAIPTATPTPMPSDLVWFAPNMGSRDYPELFTKPEQWTVARSRINVYKFYTQNVLNVPCQICGDNTLSTFVDAQAFHKLTDWGIAIGVEVGAVKQWGCTGTEELRVAEAAIQNIRANGGTVTFLYQLPSEEPCWSRVDY